MYLRCVTMMLTVLKSSRKGVTLRYFVKENLLKYETFDILWRIIIIIVKCKKIMIIYVMM